MIFQKKISRYTVASGVALLIMTGCGFMLWYGYGSHEETLSSRTGYVMDTVCTVTAPEDMQDAISHMFNQLDDALDCYNTESAVWQCNQTGISQDAILYDLVTCVQAVQQHDGAAVDITVGALTALWGITTESPKVPMQSELKQALATVSPTHVKAENGTVTLTDSAQLDFGAVAKGYALDQAAGLLGKSDAQYAVVSLVSSMLLYGEKPDGSDFTVAIRDPNGDGTLGIVQTDACFLSTSGGYERYFTAEDGTKYEHILDLQTGMPIESDLTTVTVFCDNGLRSDLLSTEIYMEGTAGLEKHLQAADYKIVAADEAGKIYVSDGLHFSETKQNES